jgi:hypothetical protein
LTPAELHVLLVLILRNIITLVSSENKIGSDKVFILGGGSFVYFIKSRGRKIKPCTTPCSTVPYFEENVSNDFISVFCFLFVK